MSSIIWLCSLLVCFYLARISGFDPKNAFRGSPAISRAFLSPEAGDGVSREVAQQRLLAIDSVGNYMPSIGLESAVYTTARTRALLGNEFSLVFDNFPGLYEIARNGTWPKPREVPLKPMQTLQQTI